MKIKSQRDFWSGLMFMVVGIAFAWGSTSYSFGGTCTDPAIRASLGFWECFAKSSAKPGAAYFPFALGMLMAVLGAMVTFKALTIEVEGGDPIGAWAWKPLLVINGAVFFFGWALPHMGMVVALPILVILSAAAGNEFHWKDAIINSVVLTIGSWFIFIWGLKLTIPLLPPFLAH